MTKDKFDVAFETRQRILDYANKHGKAIGMEVAAALGISNDYANRSMNKMVAMGEMERVGEYKAVVFYPIAKMTRPASEMRELMRDRRKDTRVVEAEKSKAKRKSAPWLTIHVCSDKDTPIQNQGGQGALRRVATIRAIEL